MKKKILTLFVISVIIALIAGYLTIYIPISEALKCTEKMNATIVSVDDQIDHSSKSEGTGEKYRCIYSFEFNGTKVEGTEYSGAYSNAWNHTVGEEVNIAVNPNNPKEFLVEPLISNYCRFAFVPLLFLVIAILALISLISGKQFITTR